jgi:hypothetical protein
MLDLRPGDLVHVKVGREGYERRVRAYPSVCSFERDAENYVDLDDGSYVGIARVELVLRSWYAPPGEAMIPLSSAEERVIQIALRHLENSPNLDPEVRSTIDAVIVSISRSWLEARKVEQTIPVSEIHRLIAKFREAMVPLAGSIDSRHRGLTTGYECAILGLWHLLKVLPIDPKQ